MIKIYFDLDGTLFDLYGKENWLDMLRNEEAGAFCGDVMPELQRRWFDFKKLCSILMEKGVQFGVISWLPSQCSDEYAEICRQEKLNWIYENIPFVIEKNIVPYGTIKQDAIQKHAQTEILLDDNPEICYAWETKEKRVAYKIDVGFTAYSALKDIYNEYFGEEEE